MTARARTGHLSSGFIVAGGAIAAISLVWVIQQWVQPVAAEAQAQAGIMQGGRTAQPTPAPSPMAAPPGSMTPYLNVAAVKPTTASAPATATAPSAAPATQARPGGPGIVPVGPYTPVVVAPGGLNNPAAYPEVVLNTKQIAAIATSKADLRAIKRAVDVYVQMNDEKFPASSKDLEAQRLLGGMPASPGNKTKTMVFISGQSAATPNNILAYDPHPYGGFRIVAIRVNGDIVEFRVPDFKKLLDEQKVKAEEMLKD